jgi:Arc/MetJ-type ribon-helix-helix transcriptional regulator
MRGEMSRKTVSVQLSEALEAQLTALIRQRRTSKAAVVRAALEAYLTRQGSPAGALVLDVVWTSVAVSRGLSTSPHVGRPWTAMVSERTVLLDTGP